MKLAANTLSQYTRELVKTSLQQTILLVKKKEAPLFKFFSLLTQLNPKNRNGISELELI
jgi:hypothetical protein